MHDQYFLSVTKEISNCFFLGQEFPNLYDPYIKTSQVQESTKQLCKNKRHYHYCESITQVDIFVALHHYYVASFEFASHACNLLVIINQRAKVMNKKQLNRLFSPVLLIVVRLVLFFNFS